MVLDLIMKWATEGANGLMDMLPGWDGTGFDPEKLHELIQTIMEWNNWIAVSDFVAAFIVYLGVYVGLQTLGALYKTADLLKPG